MRLPVHSMGAAAAALSLLLAGTPASAGTDGTIGLTWGPPGPTDPLVDVWWPQVQTPRWRERPRR